MNAKGSFSKIKNDLLCLFGVCLTAGLILAGNFFLGSKGAYVQVIQDGTVLGTYALDEDQTLRIPFQEEGYNLLQITDGKAKVTDANCPDGLCIRQRSIQKGGESIICLPHKLVIQIEGTEEKDLDTVTY